jgi:hypothetical protein
MTLTLAGCPGEAETKTEYDRRGYASDLDAIIAAFENANDVYLTKPTEIDGILAIKAGQKLHLASQPVTLKDKSVIATVSNDALQGPGSIVPENSTAKTFLATRTADLVFPNVTTAGVTQIVSDGATVSNAGGYGIVVTSELAKAFNTSGEITVGAGTTLVYINDLTVPATGYSNSGGSLTVAGNVTLSGTLSGTGDLEVIGGLISNVDTGGTLALVAGSLAARSVTLSKGGYFPYPVSLTSSSAESTVTGAGSFAQAFAGSGAITFNGAAEFTGGGVVFNGVTFGGNVKSDAQLVIDGDVKFAADKELTGYVSAKDVDLAGVLTIKSGSLATSGNVDITGSGKSIVFGLNGALKFDGGSLTATAYDINGAVGSLASVEGNGGTAITLSANSIAGTAGGDAVPKLVFGSAGLVLNIKTDGLINSKIDLDVSGGGTIAVKSLTLILGGGGSITATNIAYGGTLATAATYGGSLLVGTQTASDGGSITAEAVEAGSIGAKDGVGNFILKDSVFYPSKATVVQGSTGVYANMVTNIGTLDGGSAAAGGSIVIFGR